MSTTTNYAFELFSNGETGWGTPASNNFSLIDAEIAKPRPIKSALTWGATTTLDLSLARVFTGTNTGVATIAFSNVPANTHAVPVVLILTNGAANAITWPASVVWLGGVKPTLKASGVDIVELVTVDGGTTWLATLRNLRPGVLFQGSGSTTSAVDASVLSYTLPGGTLAVNGQAVRISAVVNVNGAQTGTLHIKFGATDLVNQAMAATGGQAVYQATVARVGATSQRFGGLLTYAPTPTSVLGGSNSVPGETLANDIVIDFRGSVTGGISFFFQSVTVELLAAA